MDKASYINFGWRSTMGHYSHKLCKFGSKPLQMKQWQLFQMLCWVTDPWHRDYMFTPFSQWQFSIYGQMGNLLSQKESTTLFFCLFPGSTCSIWTFSNPLVLASFNEDAIRRVWNYNQLVNATENWVLGTRTLRIVSTRWLTKLLVS